MYHITEAEIALFQHSCTQNCFFSSDEASFAALFSLDFFVRLKKYQHAKKLQQPLEPFHLKLSLSYMVHRTFSSKWHLQAAWTTCL